MTGCPQLIAMLIIAGLLALVCGCASSVPKIQDSTVEDGSTTTGGVVGKVDLQALSDEVTNRVAGNVEKVINSKNLVGRIEAISETQDARFKNVEQAINTQGTPAIWMFLVILVLRGFDSLDNWNERKAAAHSNKQGQ